ncbi:efflux RND transporter periplasmic adaptor subunit [Thiotrichales bacterium 19X7-9]|nr:efflux RND transporter periplasmic adaptor subunit [Thiotrichales bacterium 19X7-9]
MKPQLIKNLLLIIIGVCVGVSITRLYTNHSIVKNKSNMAHENKPLYWVAPMDPNYKRDKPGKSPMGMDLVPVYKEDHKSNGVYIAPNIIHNIGVKIEPVAYHNLTKTINTLGIVKENDNNIEHIHTYEDGWIRQLNINEIGAYVNKGELIAKIYSPKLIEAEQELVLAIKEQATSNQLSKNNPYIDQTNYVDSAISKLESLGISQQQIQRIIKNKKADTLVDIYAPISGVISELDAKEGMYITPDKNLMTIVNLNTVWLSIEIFPSQISEVKIGDKVIGKVNGIENMNFSGKIDFISPTIDPTTRTFSARATLVNNEKLLKPNLYMDVTIESKMIKHSLAVPKSAVIRLKNIDYVIVADKNNNFSAQEIKIGLTTNDYYQILAGLQSGDAIVTSAQFLIDSESDIQASLKRLTTSTDDKKANSLPHSHHRSH